MASQLRTQHTKKKTNGRTETGVYPKNKINFGRVYSEFIRGMGKNTGASTCFLGVSRLESADGRKKVKTLVMESYEEHANSMLKKICKEVKSKHKLNDILIVHALGRFKPGEPVVLVAVSSPRRDASFNALKEAVERYKKEPALFKQEVYSDGSSSWVH